MLQLVCENKRLPARIEKMDQLILTINILTTILLPFLWLAESDGSFLRLLEHVRHVHDLEVVGSNLPPQPTLIAPPGICQGVLVVWPYS